MRLVALASAGLAACLAVCLGTGALAAPPRPLRPIPAPATAPATSSLLQAARGAAETCGTRLEATPEILIEHFSRPESVPLPTPNSTDAGEIAVLEDDGTFFFDDKNGNQHVDLASVAQAFYRTHGDDYECLAVYLSSGLNAWHGSPTALASAYPLRNRIRGIGLSDFDYGAAFGSPSRLEVLLSMNGLHRYLNDPLQPFPNDTFSALDVLAHEFGHRWLSYVYVDSAGTPSPALLGRDYQHWNFFFDCDSSYMEGNDWAIAGPDSFRTDGAVGAYGTLDLYLMGLLAPAAIDSFFVVNDPVAFDPPGIYIPGTPPVVGLGCRGRATWWTIGDLENVNGPRIPDAASAPHGLRMAVILVTARGVAATAPDLAKLEALRSVFSPAYAVATRGLGSANLTLVKHAGKVSIAHTPLKDTEDAPSPRPVGARVSIAQAGIPIALDPSSVRAWWRLAGGGAYAGVPLPAAGPDSFAAALPPQASGSTVEYYLHAGSDSAGIDADHPAAGPAAPHVYHVGPDATPPVIAHTPVREQSFERMPQTVLARVTDNLAVDSVWVQFAADGGPIQSAPALPAGRDSFALALGAGLGAGHGIAYRFVARDAAAAHNQAASSATFDTLRVGQSRVWDFENGADGFLHGPQWWSYRDSWHLTQESASPAGGSAWKCGAEDSLPYAPHLDANLYTPALASLPAISVLRFDHRYDLEEADPGHAWDGARVEGQVNGGPWQILDPVQPYDHTFLHNSNPFQFGAPCWSGSSNGWRSEIVDLTPLGPGPARVRFRMLADDFFGERGWTVDHIRIEPWNGPGAVGPPPVAAGIGRPWPNPAGRDLSLSVVLARSARAEWALFDVSGRRVAPLWAGAVPSGGFTLRASLPAVPPGLYFARLALDGRAAGTARVAVVR